VNASEYNRPFAEIAHMLHNHPNECDLALIGPPDAEGNAKIYTI
jgi:hypothetical protein